MWQYTYSDELFHHGVLGMKWGVRRYQNKDGTLTNAGKKRYNQEVVDNNAKKKDNRAQLSTYDKTSGKLMTKEGDVDYATANRWAKDNIKNTKSAVDAAKGMADDTKRLINTFPKNNKKQQMDLSEMTDQQLRDRINRANLERQYIDIFSEETTHRGRANALKTLEVAGSVLAVGSSALGIALSIRDILNNK